MKIIECPRDAMQGLHTFIPTRDKVEYLNLLLQVGFDTLDFGSFVSPKAIPQMRDTGDVVRQLKLNNTDTKLLAIVANKRGALDATQYNNISYLGYPFSISETFQLRNTNATISESLERVKMIQEICIDHNKTLVIYISMGFGNPYGDDWNVQVVQYWVEVLKSLGITIIQLSDTIGVAQADNISYFFGNLIPNNTDIEIGAHFHTHSKTWFEKTLIFNPAYSFYFTFPFFCASCTVALPNTIPNERACSQGLNLLSLAHTFYPANEHPKIR